MSTTHAERFGLGVRYGSIPDPALTSVSVRVARLYRSARTIRVTNLRFASLPRDLNTAEHYPGIFYGVHSERWMYVRFVKWAIGTNPELLRWWVASVPVVGGTRHVLMHAATDIRSNAPFHMGDSVRHQKMVACADMCLRLAGF
jgi:hypothetical protein